MSDSHAQRFESVNTEEKLTLASLASALVNGDQDMYEIHAERLWNLQQDRVLAILLALNISMHNELLSRNMISSTPEEADAFFLSCYSHFPSQVVENLDEDSKVSWFVAPHLLRFAEENSELYNEIYELLSYDIIVTTTQLILAAVAHAFALSSDPVAYVQEELDAVQINISTNPDMVQIPAIYTPSYFTANGEIVS